MDSSSFKIIRQRRASIALKILRNGQIEIKAPYLIPESIIKGFVEKHAGFIEKNRKKILASVPVRKRYVAGEKFLFMGNEYIFTPYDTTAVKIVENKLLFPKALLYRAEKELENWYMKSAKENISKLVEEYAKAMNTTYAELRFSDTSSKWGSCTSDNRLQFNWRLIMAPLIVMRYVVIHELAHTTEKNHSRAFWAKVAAQNPSYKQQIKWLREHGNKLIA